MGNQNALLIASCMTVFSLLLGGCAPAAPAAKPAPATAQPATRTEAPVEKQGAPAATPKPAAETPRYGGLLTNYVIVTLGTMDPHQGTAEVSQSISPVYTTLVQADPLTNDKWVPGLAEKWEMSKDGLTWNFDIRQGVKFHDGAPFTIDDAVFTLKRLTNPPKGVVSTAASFLGPVVKSIDKDGNRVRITLSHPFALILDILAQNYAAMLSEKYMETGNLNTTAMGTGPFKFKSYTPAVSLEGVKNPDFWVKGRPYLDGYRVVMLKDEATRISAFRTGKVNITGKLQGALRPSEMESLKKDMPDARFYPSPSFNGAWFFMNSRKPPFQDLRVRKAVHLALDRQAAFKVVANGYGMLAQPFPIEPWKMPEEQVLRMPGYRQPKDADMAEAKKLMADAGYGNGFEATILARHNWQSKDGAVFMTSQLASLGIKARVQLLEDAIFWDTGRKAGHESMVYTPSWPMTDPHYQGRFWAPGGTLNYSGNEGDKELIAMWDEQIKTVDADKRKALINKVALHLLETLPGAPIVWYYVFIGVRPEVRNFAAGVSDLVGNTRQEIWLAK